MAAPAPSLTPAAAQAAASSILPPRSGLTAGPACRSTTGPALGQTKRLVLHRGAAASQQFLPSRRPLCLVAAAGVSALLISAAASRRVRPFSLASILSRLPKSAALSTPLGTQRVPGTSFSFTSAAMANVSIGTPAMKTITVPAKGEHKATVIFMHGLGDTGEGWADIPPMLKLSNVKFVFPSAPIKPVSVNGGFPCPSWFDIFGLSAESKEDSVGIDRAAQYIAGILAEEKQATPGAKIFVGGFSQGGALSLHLTTRKFAGTFLDGSDASGVPLDGTICLSGWLPAADKATAVKSPEEAAKHPVLCCHGQMDTLVQYSFGQRSAEALKALGFSSLQFKSYRDLPHSACPEELQDLKAWLESLL